MFVYGFGNDIVIKVGFFDFYIYQMGWNDVECCFVCVLSGVCNVVYQVVVICVID